MRNKTFSYVRNATRASISCVSRTDIGFLSQSFRDLSFCPSRYVFYLVVKRFLLRSLFRVTLMSASAYRSSRLAVDACGGSPTISLLLLRCNSYVWLLAQSLALGLVPSARAGNTASCFLAITFNLHIRKRSLTALRWLLRNPKED